MSDPDNNSHSPKANLRKIAFGFGGAAVLFALPSLSSPGELGRMIEYFFVDVALSLVAVVLAIIPFTRKFGLGMLLACGLAWLLMLAICGGLRIG